MPRYVFTGQGALDKASEDIKLLGKKALIVTDDVMIKLDSISNITNLLDKLEVNYSIYHDVNGEPTDVMVNNGIKQYKDNNCDFLIALGGGSPIDTMKAIGAMITNSGEINDYLGKIIEKETPPSLQVLLDTAVNASACFLQSAIL